MNLRAVILLLVLFALFVAVGSLFGAVGAAIALAIAIVLSFWSFWSAASTTIAQTNAVHLNDASVLEATATLAARAGIPPPRIYEVQDSQANAFALGSSPQSTSVILTNTLCAELTQTQLHAVIAHEIAHIRNRDTLACTYASGEGRGLTRLCRSIS